MSKPIIYIYEDDAAIRELLVTILVEDLGAEVVASGNIAATRELAQRTPPDLIVADFWGTSQLSLSDSERAELQQLSRLAPLVLVSARSWTAGADLSELGVFGLLPKPLDLDAFLSMLRDALADRGPRQADAGARDPGELSVFILPWNQ